MPTPVPKTNGVSANAAAAPKKPSRNQLKRDKKKARKHAAPTDGGETTTDAESSVGGTDTESEMDSELETPSSSTLDLANLDSSDPNYAAFASIFSRFQPEAEEDGPDGIAGDGEPKKGEVIYSDEEGEEEDEDGQPVVSKKKQKKLARLSVAELKTLVAHPEVIEWTDPSARDPRLLVELKSYRNTVPVPSHWNAKRDYLQGKRGMERPQFQLPSYIADTGIATQRDAIKEKEETQTLKQKTRERVQPKMGKIDIDYQKLHDAFFRFQTKPKLTSFGEVYYEGKELEADVKEKRPGELSLELQEALSIPPLAPPPWLINQQRFGPPPSYTSLRIPGLNAPIPTGAQWGFHPGGWGKPPVDEFNRPIYGDVFGVAVEEANAYSAPVNRELWGELEPEDEDEEESEEEESEEEEEADGARPPQDGLETPSGTQSIVSTVPGGLETPEFLDIRKAREDSFSRAGTESVEPSSRQLYQVIEERATNVRGFMGSAHGYDLGGVGGAAPPVLGQEDRGVKRKQGAVDLSLDPAELANLSKEELEQRYEASRQAASSNRGTGEDFSDLFAEENRRKQSRASGGRDGGSKGGGGGRDRRGDDAKYKF